MTDATKVLLLEDMDFDANITMGLLKRCRTQKYDVTRCTLLSEAVGELNQCDYPVALIDMNVPDSDGLNTVDKILEANKNTAIIILTGADDDIIRENDVAVVEVGAADFLVKGQVSSDLLERSIRFAVTRQKLVNTEQQAKELLDEKNKRLLEFYQTANTFVDTVSHEFRTPLTVIKEFAGILQDGLLGDVSAEQRDYLGTIIERVNDLSDMVCDLLDVSKLEQGSLGICRQTWPVESILKKVVPTLEMKARSCDVELTVDIDEDVTEVYCDAEKIGRVLINLCVNGIKFASGGKVTLWARRHSNGAEVQFGVTDDGPGIEPDSLKEIFDRFTQLKTNYRSSTKGFGLGLNIAKELVQLNFGDITVESEPNVGSTFSFTVPTFQPSHLVKRFAERAKVLRGDQSHLALINVKVDEDDDIPLLSETYQVLHYHLRSSDLVLRKSRNNWWLVITSNQPCVDPFIERINKALESENDHRVDNKLPSLEMSPIGQYDLDTNFEHFLSNFDEEYFGPRLEWTTADAEPPTAASA
ncbi:MAG: hybrid sensor histidine kinase/response regulator [Pseudomonadota bacterium]